MLLFLGKSESEVADELDCKPDDVSSWIEDLYRAGIGTRTRSGRLAAVPELTTTQAEMVSGICSRRLRQLADEKRIESRHLNPRCLVLNSDSLKRFLRIPRKSGMAGSILLRGKPAKKKTAKRKARPK